MVYFEAKNYGFWVASKSVHKAGLESACAPAAPCNRMGGQVMCETPVVSGLNMSSTSVYQSPILFIMQFINRWIGDMES